MVEKRSQAKKSTFKKRLLYALLFCLTAATLSSFIYAGLNLTHFVRVWKTSALWFLILTIQALWIHWLTSKVTFDRFSKPAFFAIHLAAALVSSTSGTAMTFLSLYIYADPDIKNYLYQMYPQFFHISLFVYAAVAGWFYFLQFQRRSKEYAVKEANLEKLSKEAELKALKAQVNPHFLFNALNSVNALIMKNPKKAREMNTRLASILRYVLDGSESQVVTLQQEMDFIRDYLSIEKIRLGEKLQLQIHIDNTLLDMSIPPIILQPLVENAIKHGIAKQTRGGLLKIEVKAVKEKVTCRVTDTGPGMANPDKEALINHGMGLRNIQERLKWFYEDDFTFTIENHSPSGTVATIIVPLKRGVK